MTLQLYQHTDTLLLLLSCNAFGRVHNRLSKIIVCFWVLTCDSGLESESAKFYQLQLRLRLRSKRSTPNDSNSSLDSDSAALVWPQWHESPFLVHIFIFDIYLLSLIKLMAAIFTNYTACRERQDKCNVRKVWSLIDINDLLQLFVSADAKLASVLGNKYAHGWTSGNCWSVLSFYDAKTKIPTTNLPMLLACYKQSQHQKSSTSHLN